MASSLKSMGERIVEIIKHGIDANNYEYMRKNILTVLDAAETKKSMANVEKIVRKYHNKIDFYPASDYYDDYKLPDIESSIEVVLDGGKVSVANLKKDCKEAIKNINDFQKVAIKEVEATKRSLSSFLKDLEAAEKKDKSKK